MLPELQVYWLKMDDVDCQIVVLLINVGAQIEGIIYPRLKECKRGSSCHNKDLPCHGVKQVHH